MSLLAGCQPNARSQTLLYGVVAPGPAEQKVDAREQAVIAKRLPKTRSGKILRGTMRAIVDGDDYRMPATIDDPAILDEIKAVVGGSADV